MFRERSVGARLRRKRCEWTYEGGRKALGRVKADGGATRKTRRRMQYAVRWAVLSANLGGTAGKFSNLS